MVRNAQKSELQNSGNILHMHDQQMVGLKIGPRGHLKQGLGSNWNSGQLQIGIMVSSKLSVESELNLTVRRF